MKITKKRLLLALILVLLLVSTLSYFGSGFLSRKTQLQREALLVRRQISKALQPAPDRREDVGPDLETGELAPIPPEAFEEEPDSAVLQETDVEDISEPTAGETSISQSDMGEVRESPCKGLEATIRKLKGDLLEKERKIEAWKRRWKAENRELERYKRELMALKNETMARERKLLAQKPGGRAGERAKPEMKEGKSTFPDRPTGPPLVPSSITECEGVPISHRSAALLLCRELNLGSDLSYAQAVMGLHGLGISPRAGWNQGDPWSPMGPDELEEVISEAKNAISIGLAAADYSELAEGLRQYCRRERAQMVEQPKCEGPMVTECVECDISQGDFAIYLCKVLGIGEDLNWDQSFSALTALRVSPRRGWNFEDPFIPMSEREIEEVRCSAQEAHEKGLIKTSSALMVASINDYCIWLRMNVEVVGGGVVADTVATTDYQRGGGTSIPKGGIVKSASN
jgi:hypothetical protein